MMRIITVVSILNKDEKMYFYLRIITKLYY